MLKSKLLWGAVLVLVVAGGMFVAYEANKLSTAHSSFENYYAFRGCTQLVDRTDTYGDCKLADGSTIKIVKYNDKWYLDGDLPWGCIGSICLGW